MARTKGMSGVAIGMIGAGALLVYSAIKNSSPLAELRGILTGKRPEPLSTETRATPLASGLSDFGGGSTGGSGKLSGTTGVKANVLSAMQFISDFWGIETVGMGPGSVPNSDHPKGLALDAMTTSLAIGNAIVAYFIANASTRRVKYIIWQRRIWFPGLGWSRYTGPNPHTDHVHISFYEPGNVRAQ